MSLIPTFSSPCQLATSMPDMIADFLDSGRNIGKKFREETVSDIIVASIIKLDRREIIVLTPNETTTGADFDIAIVDPKSKESIQFRIQSKQLTPNRTNWRRSSYKELDHPHGTGGQTSTLIRSSAHERIPTIPLYAFYNPRGICDASAGRLSGMEMADGKTVSALVKSLVHARPSRLPVKRLEVLMPLFFPFSKILCATQPTPSDDQRIIPRPEDVRRSVRDAIDSRMESDYGPFAGLLPPSEIPELKGSRAFDIDPETVDRTLPAYIEQAIKQRDVTRSIKSPIKRPKIVLISEPKE